MKIKPPAQPNASLIAGLECLHEVASSGTVGGRELARRLKMEPTRAHRLLKTLASEGYLTQDKSGRYEPGPAMHLLSAQSLHSSGLLRRAAPVLESLGRFKSVIALGMLWRTQVVYLFHAGPGERASAGIARQPFFPASMSSPGLALLALRDEEEIAGLYPDDIPGFDSRDALLKRLHAIRKSGYAEATFGPRTSVGVALDFHTAIALGSVNPDAVDEAVRELKNAADIIRNTVAI